MKNNLNSLVSLYKITKNTNLLAHIKEFRKKYRFEIRNAKQQAHDSYTKQAKSRPNAMEIDKLSAIKVYKPPLAPFHPMILINIFLLLPPTSLAVYQ